MAADEFRAFCESHSVTNASKLPEGYSGSSRRHYGLSAPLMHDFVKDWMAAHKSSLTFDAWVQTLDGLYHGESLEEHIFAGLLMAKYAAFRQKLSLAQLNIWLGELEGWAEIDSTCQSSFTAKEVLAAWEQWEPFLRALSQDAHISRRRASLVILIRPLRESDDARLITLALNNIDRLKHEKDKLITKAVSWVLREGTKQHAPAVQAYVNANTDSLPKIALREVQSKLTTGRKVNRDN